MRKYYIFMTSLEIPAHIPKDEFQSMQRFILELRNTGLLPNKPVIVNHCGEAAFDLTSIEKENQFMALLPQLAQMTSLPGQPVNWTSYHCLDLYYQHPNLLHTSARIRFDSSKKTANSASFGEPSSNLAGVTRKEIWVNTRPRHQQVWEDDLLLLTPRDEVKAVYYPEAVSETWLYDLDGRVNSASARLSHVILKKIFFYFPDHGFNNFPSGDGNIFHTGSYLNAGLQWVRHWIVNDNITLIPVLSALLSDGNQDRLLTEVIPALISQFGGTYRFQEFPIAELQTNDSSRAREAMHLYHQLNSVTGLRLRHHRKAQG